MYLISITIITMNEYGGNVLNFSDRVDKAKSDELWTNQFDGGSVRSAGTGTHKPEEGDWYSQTGIHADGTIRTWTSFKIPEYVG